MLEDNDRFKYSNIGYGLLGLVIEAVTGTSYNEHVQTAIVDKLGLTDLGPELDPSRSAQYAAGYSAYAYADQRVPIEHVDTGALASATGFYGTAQDLVTLLVGAPARRRPAADRRVQAADAARAGGRPTGGRRVAVRARPDGVDQVGERDLFGHSGGYPGHITRSMVDPERRIAVSVLTNAIDGPARQLAEGVFKLVDLAESKPRQDATGLARFTGRFANLWGVIDVALLGGRLYVIDPTADDPAADPTTLEADGDDLRVTGGSGYGGYR